MSAPECWLHGVHLPRGESWPRAWPGDFKPSSPDFLAESAERRYRLERLLQRAATGQTLTSKSRSSSRWYGNFSGLKRPPGKASLCMNKEGIVWEAKNHYSALLIPMLLADVMFAPVDSKLVPPLVRAPEATHLILIAPRAAGGVRPSVWLLCTIADDCSLDHLIMSLSMRGAVRWDVRQCLHIPGDSLGKGSHGTILAGMSLLPLHEEHRKLIPAKADVLNMNKVHNFARVAVKIWDKLDSAMVRREVGFLQQSAGHPNISALLGVYAEVQTKSSVTWLLAMEHCTGSDLFSTIKADNLPLGFILEIQVGLSSALAHLHCLNIVHRDVKAENVVMQKERAVLIDFGIAAYRDDKEAMCAAIGSPGYAAPEIISPREGGYDELVDVFALGVLSYFMMFRALPFWGKTQDETLEKTELCEAEVPELNDGRWRAVVSLVLRMMSKDSQDRPSAMACFKELTELEPVVTKGRKSRAVRIAHAALVHYGYLDAPGDCSVEEFCGSAAPEICEDASPRVAASRASLLSRAGRMLTAVKGRMPLMRVPRVRHMVSKAFRSSQPSEAVSKVPLRRESESQSCDAGHSLAQALDFVLDGDAEADAEVTGVLPKATNMLPGLVVSNSSEAGKNPGDCSSTIIADSENNDQKRERVTCASIVLDFPVSSAGKAADDHNLLLEGDGQDGASSDPPTDGAKLPHPPTDREVLSSRQCDLRRFSKRVSESPDESREVPQEADAFEFAPVLSDELE
ncbi:CPK2 [Symbiodinium microadriaticum]|nr:CPK2 [Symbiodinium microadriaticum]